MIETEDERAKRELYETRHEFEEPAPVSILEWIVIGACAGLLAAGAVGFLVSLIP